jgi:hypothetical protein
MADDNAGTWDEFNDTLNMTAGYSLGSEKSMRKRCNTC